MINIHDFDATAARLAGVLGALVGMRFISGTWPEKISLAISGAIAAYYVTPWISELTGAPERIIGFLIGLFGMAIVDKAWQTIQAFPIGLLWQAIIDRVRGRG